ncbi:iron-sulfur cluster assembly scaffold protein [archaeon]|jgi:nitrogen fixation protein NifU and related proteins|nr:iron-sulfur cluster assembly scaffold protein [archaeon]
MVNKYGKEVMKHFTSPEFMGEMKNPSAVGELGNMKCGDIMKIYLKIFEGKIEDISFQTFGCVAAIASSDVLCELAKGKSLEEAKKITNKMIIEKLGGLPSIKEHCSVLGAGALKKAVENYESKKK